jgi:hypothetical protein
MRQWCYFNFFGSDKWLKSFNNGKVFQYLFENKSIFVVNSTNIDNAAMLRLFFYAYCLRKGESEPFLWNPIIRVFNSLVISLSMRLHIQREIWLFWELLPLFVVVVADDLF